MDMTTNIESVGPSEARSEGLGDKRPLENGEFGVPLAKKARGDGELAASVRKAAEIVLVLAMMGKMRAARKPTAAELEMMAEAREKLAQVCVEFAPKDIFPRDAFGTLIEDLGFSKLREQRLGIRPKMSIAEKLLLAKQKMAKSEEFSQRPTTYSSPRLQTNLAGTTESCGTTQSVRVFTSDKPSPVPALSKSFQHPSHPVHASPANSTSLPYQLPTSEVRPVAPSVLPATHPGRDSSSSLAFPRVDRAHLRLDARSNGSPYASQIQANSSGDHPTARTTAWSMQPPSASSVKVGHDKVPMHISVKADGAADANMSRMAAQATMSRPFVTQTTPSNRPITNQHLQGTNSVQAPNSHNDIGKIVQKLLQPQLPEKQTWTPPSRDYMNKALTCQICKITINEVDTALVCDACEKGYHLRCLNFNSKGIPKSEWHCGKCLALSNGKPLPPKYGRVMRNIGMQKILSQGTAFQPSLDRKVEISNEKGNQQQITANGNSGLQSASENVDNNNIQPTSSIKMEDFRGTLGDKLISQGGKMDDKSSSEACPNNLIRTSEAISVSSSSMSVERSFEKNLAIESRSQPPANSEAVTTSSDHSQAAGNRLNGNQTRVPNSDEILPKQSRETNLTVNHVGQSLGGETVLCNSNGEVKQVHQEVERANPSETTAFSVGVREPARSSPNNMHDVEWVGDILEVADEKTYYQSFRINGVVYKVEDHALLPSPSDKYTPSKLRVMWEDSKTSSKWVTVSRCYFPNDLPKGVGRPCSSESNEVYESNQTSALMAGVIHGPCEVLPPSKFDEESERRAHLKTGASVGLRPLFLCKWLYDESKEVFRDVTC